jgi:2,4-dienoyl-CoA reductase-like NADH-dependent reductase (Old Yellow Enzyme family)
MIDDSMVAARALEDAGMGVLGVSDGFSGFPETGLALLTEVKRAVGIPVILTAGIKNVEIVDQLLQEGKADLINLLGITADPKIELDKFLVSEGNLLL